MWKLFSGRGFEQRVTSSVLVLLIALSTESGCKDDAVYIDVAVRTSSEQVRSLAVNVWLDGERISRLGGQVRTPWQDFVVKLPAAASAPSAKTVRVVVGGMGADGCQLALGEGTLKLSGQPRDRLEVEIVESETHRGCRLIVGKVGQGLGRVTISVDGQVASSCEFPDSASVAPCQTFYPVGTQLTINPEPAKDSVFLGWEGACETSEPCRLTVTGEPLTLSSAFSSRRVCSTSNWCWENPLPHGSPLLALWGSGPNDLWAVGPELVQHWNGRFWLLHNPGTMAASLFFGIWGTGPKSAWAVGTNGTLTRWDGTSWRQQTSGITEGFVKTWGSGDNDVWAVGPAGLIVHWDGRSFQKVASQSKEWLSDIWGSAADDVWAVGENGTVLRWNGKSWNPILSGTKESFQSVWGLDAQHIWLCGAEGSLVHWDGSKFTEVNYGQKVDSLSDVWGSSVDDIWVSGRGTVLHWDGKRWATGYSGVSGLQGALWGYSQNDVWLLGVGGDLQHWDGLNWTSTRHGNRRRLNDVWASAPDDVWAVGDAGTIV